VADVNARGGLNGHPVQLISADDGGDPSRALALARRMVEQDGAVALYGDMLAVTIQAVTPYVEQRRISLIGGCGCNPIHAESPMVFLVGSYSGEALSWGHILPLTAFSDKRKISMLWCRESPTCQQVRDQVRKFGPQVGIEIVHDAQVSLVQPDFTAEVLAARNAGADAVVMALENPSVVRVARSAHRQDWYPLLVTQWSALDERFLSIGGEDIEGVLHAGSMPHWDSPRLVEYKEAMKRIPGGVKASMGTATFEAGKLMEKISTGFSENPTSEDFLRGLHALNGETLDGLIPPLTYREGERHGDSNMCIIPFRVQNGQFVSKDGDNWLCPPGWTPVRK
jgi:branched-chain amino acid transport system substrate-binding protein